MNKSHNPKYNAMVAFAANADTTNAARKKLALTPVIRDRRQQTPVNPTVPETSFWCITVTW